MRIVVTGGAGFIGANLCRTLASSDEDEVIAFDDLSSGTWDNLPDGSPVERVTASITDRGALDEAVRGADSVVHLAARPSVPRSLDDPVASHVANATGTLNVLEAARAHDAHVTVASSSSVYGSNRGLPKREDAKASPMSPYAATKLAAEAYALAWQHSYGLPVLTFRFFNVFGPLQPAGHAYAAVVPAFIDAALAGRPVLIHGDGCQTRDFTFVGTVAEVLADTVRRQVTHPEPVNLAFGSRVSMLELTDVIEAAVGHPVARQHGPARVGDVRDSQADTANLRSLFPHVEAVALDDGMAETVAWFRRGAELDPRADDVGASRP